MDGDWLIKDVWFVGVHMQNWMLVVIAICIVSLAVTAWQERRSS
jgi:hypothetical protein